MKSFEVVLTHIEEGYGLTHEWIERCVFDTPKQAEEYLKSKLLEYLYFDVPEQLNHKVYRLQHFVNRKGVLHRKHTANLQSLEFVAKVVAKGDQVPYNLVWSIAEVERPLP